MSLRIYAVKKGMGYIPENQDIEIIPIATRISETDLSGNAVKRIEFLKDIEQEDDSPLNVPITWFYLKNELFDTTQNWLDVLLGASQYPSSIRSIEFDALTNPHKSFSAMTLIYDYGRYFLTVYNPTYPEHNYVFMIEDDKAKHELLKPYKNGSVFRKDTSVSKVMIGYGHKSIGLIVNFNEDSHPTMYRINFKEEMTSNVAFNLFLKGDSSFIITDDLFDCESTNHKSVVRAINLTKVEDLFYFETEDTKVSFSTKPRMDLDVIRQAWITIDRTASAEDIPEVVLMFRSVLMETLKNAHPSEATVDKGIAFIKSRL
jgi:hypothetical protein